MNNTTLTTLDLPGLHRSFIGVDRLISAMNANSNLTHEGYPPYNIAQIPAINGWEEDKYMISLAVAGFSMDNLEITKDGNQLKIEGTAPKGDEEVDYLHKGIGGRNFRREFTLADYVEVDGANLELGMLNIHLKRELPEALKPRKIDITISG